MASLFCLYYNLGLLHSVAWAPAVVNTWALENLRFYRLFAVLLGSVLIFTNSNQLSGSSMSFRSSTVLYFRLHVLEPHMAVVLLVRLLLATCKRLMPFVGLSMSTHLLWFLFFAYFNFVFMLK